MFTSLHQINLRDWARRLFCSLTIGGAHLLGIAVIFATSSWLLIPAESRAALHEAAQYGLLESLTFEILLQAGLSGCVWALIVIIWKLVTSHADTSPRLVKAQGTVIVETLIVFPVFLLVTLGLMQLALLNTAGLLTSLAAFNAGRTVAVWYPEALEGRNGVTVNDVREKARLSAAAAVAPAAPSDFTTPTDGCADSATLDARLESLKDAGHEDQSGASGGAEFSLTAAFDQSTFSARGQSKLQFAHCATTVDFVETQGAQKVWTQVEYRQHMAIPLVPHIFGESDTIGGRTAMYATLNRDHITTHQIQSNECTPGGSAGGLDC